MCISGWFLDAMSLMRWTGLEAPRQGCPKYFDNKDRLARRVVDTMAGMPSRASCPVSEVHIVCG